MWKIDDNGDAYNTDDPRDFMFVQQQIEFIIVHRSSDRVGTIDGFFSVDAAKKHLAQMVKELNAKEQELEEI